MDKCAATRFAVFVGTLDNIDVADSSKMQFVENFPNAALGNVWENERNAHTWHIGWELLEID